MKCTVTVLLLILRLFLVLSVLDILVGVVITVIICLIKSHFSSMLIVSKLIIIILPLKTELRIQLIGIYAWPRNREGEIEVKMQTCDDIMLSKSVPRKGFNLLI